MTALHQMCLCDQYTILDLSFHAPSNLIIFWPKMGNGATITSLMLKSILPNIRDQSGPVPLCSSLTPLK